MTSASWTWTTATIGSPAFQCRNKIGPNTRLRVLEAYRQRRGFNVDTLMKYAAICRVAKVMRPYVEAIL